MIKHNLISLITHSKNVANIATVIARQHLEGIETQAATWQFGFVHDVGWLNLKSVGQVEESFEHDHATIDVLNALKELAQVKEPFTISEDLLVRFASLHAKQHKRRERRRIRKEIERFLEDEGFNPKIVNYVCWADSLATTLEIPGKIHQVPRIIHFFTTPLYLDVPDRHFNMMRKRVHAFLLHEFINLLDGIRAEIVSELKFPFDPIISTSLEGVEYTLDIESNKQLLRSYRRWLLGEVEATLRKAEIQPYSAREILEALLFKPSDWNKACIFCGASSKYIKNLYKVNRIFAKKAGKTTSRLTASFWTERIQGSERTKGVCPVCFYALMKVPFRRKPEIAVAIPRLDAVPFRKERLEELLRIWRKLADEGVCKPNPAVFDIKTWLGTPYWTRYYGDIDSRVEAYNYVRELYRKVCELLREKFEVEDLSVIAFLDGDLCELASLLESRNFPLILVNSLRVVGDLNTVVLCSYPLDRERGLAALRFLGAVLDGKAVEELIAASGIEEFVTFLETSKTVKEWAKRRIFTVLVEEGELVERVFEEVKACCEKLK